MESLTVLIPKIRPPDVPDIINNQLENILKELGKKYELHVVWLVFQSTKFKEYNYQGIHVIDYHQFNDAIEIFEKIKPNLIINEVRLGFNGIIFGISSRFKKIPSITITPTGKSELFTQFFSTKSNLQLLFSDKILGDVSNKNKKFGMLKYSIERYFFLLRTLKKCSYGNFRIIKFLSFFPRVQLFSKSYPALHNITRGNLNFCFNQHWYDRLLKSGFDKLSLILVGDPAFDEKFLEIKNSTTFNESKKIRILFCPTPMHEHGWLTKVEEDNMILSILKEILKESKFKISLKIHPSSSSYDEYTSLLNSLNRSIQLFQKQDIMSLLQKFDIMLTYGSSNVILNGILSKIPVILFNFDQKNKLSRLSDSEIITECNEIKELCPQIFSSIQNQPSKEIFENYIKTQIGTFDGRNSERIVEHIEKLFKKKIKSKF